MTKPSKSRWALDPVVAVGMIVYLLIVWRLAEFFLWPQVSAPLRRYRR